MAYVMINTKAKKRSVPVMFIMGELGFFINNYNSWSRMLLNSPYIILEKGKKYTQKNIMEVRGQ